MGEQRMWSSGLLGLVVYALMLIPTANGWDAPSPHQYHIQTDEGPERYFRYQTDSGQYRKEKRLEDGTVIGTYAWIDADGVLRQRDYIADNAGYRILKTKNVFVGRNVDVGAAVKSAKKFAASAGTLVKSNQSPVRPVVTVPYSATTETVISTTPRPYVVTTPNSVLNSGVSTYVDSPSKTVIASTPGGLIFTSTEVPIVEITPNSYPKQVVFSTPSPQILAPNVRNFTQISENYLPVTTEVPFYQSTPLPSTQYIPSPPTVHYIPSSETGYNVPQIYSQEIDQNSLEYSNPYVRQVDNSYRFQNGPTYPLDRNGRPYNGQNFDYNSGHSQYDGVSVTNDGFRYYIPRAYHEEQTLPGDKRSGSFGYIDPFGIRRVIYYNAAPGTGFQHRKNNRYVGFDATPYDPRY